MYLVPKDFADAIRPNRTLPGFQSRYRIFNEWYEIIAEGPVKVVEIDRQMQVKFRGIPHLGRYIQLVPLLARMFGNRTSRLLIHVR